MTQDHRPGDETPTVDAIPPVNPLLSQVRMPGETFTLPSKGVFYNNGELSAKATKGAEVTIYPMSVVDEITIKTPDKLFNGDAITEVFARCIPDVIKPNELLAKDVDFLMLCLRKVSYGNTIEFQHRHEGCAKSEEDANGEVVSKRNSYVVEIHQFINGSKHIDPTTASKIFSVSLDNGRLVKFNPLRFGDFITMMQAMEREDDGAVSVDVQLKNLVDSLVSVISSVDDITDKAMVAEWIPTLSPAEFKLINSTLQASVHWGPDFMYKVSCKDCGETMEVVAPQNPLVYFS